MTDKSFKQFQKLLEPIQKSLVDIDKRLDGHDRNFGEINKKLDQHTEILGQHTKTLDQHTEILGQHTKTLDQHTEILGQHTSSLVNIENTIKIYDDMYQINDDNARKLEKRVVVLENKGGIEAPPELRLANLT